MNLDKLVISTETDIEKEELNKLILSLSEEDKNDLFITSKNDIDDDENYNNLSDKSIDKILKEQTNLKKGDLVIHIEHGLGKFIGLETVEFEDVKNDFIKIEYANNATLLIPIENIDLITKYSEQNNLIKLDSLGSNKWSVRKAKIRQNIKDISNQLIRIASQRKLLKAPVITGRVGEYEDFKSDFEFEFTHDQKKALSNIENDFSKGIPMDRLLCGDVGYGKTEVAICSAFLVASNGFQVVVIAPTTLLANQHYKKFCDRFKNTDLNIVCLSRVGTVKENNEIKKAIKNGDANIIVGTHTLLNKNIEFKNLGLVVIDEEQRFGVKQKEKLKDYRLTAHILSMSATPIPRTLQMSMSGIKDLSIIATAPKDRKNVETTVGIYDDNIIKEFVDRELARNGKIFFVVPRIQDIKEVEARIEKVVPYVNYVIIHGQMDASVSNELMNDFSEGKYNVLISTTIIENGIDIPSANTIIVYRANNFGLSQLYQLRGRVGRSNVQAYAYLTMKSSETITDTAKKRLQIMESIDGLNAGFKIASEDMDLRGTGNLVGVEQSGHIKDIGVELYNQLLKEAIQCSSMDSDNKENNLDYSPEIKLGVSTIIPSEYINNPVVKMSFYRRIADIETVDDKNNIEQELIKRFGKIIESVNNLLQIALIKVSCKKLNIQRLKKKEENISIKFFNDKIYNSEKLIDYILKHPNEFKLSGNNILYLDKKKLDVFERCNELMDRIMKIVY